MLRWSLCDYSNAYILVSGTITTTGVGGGDERKWLDERKKWVKSKIVHHSLTE